jgi:hypothetical protein
MMSTGFFLVLGYFRRAFDELDQVNSRYTDLAPLQVAQNKRPASRLTGRDYTIGAAG